MMLILHLQRLMQVKASHHHRCFYYKQQTLHFESQDAAHAAFVFCSQLEETLVGNHLCVITEYLNDFQADNLH